METNDALEKNNEMEDLPSHEILRENLKPKTRGKRNKLHFTELRCPDCGKVFPDKAGLVKHVQIHNVFSPFACLHCEYKCKTKQYLSRHTKRVHGGPPTKHVCELCGKGFHFRSALVSHERVHTGAKPYACDVCGKSFSARYSWQTHMLIHTDEKPFKCPYCPYACRDNSTIRRHKERHLGTLKMYHCDICQRRFDSNAKLATHVKDAHIEPEVRRFPCTKCNSKFKSGRALKIHMERVHDRTMACTCPVCGVAVSSRCNLKQHLRRHLRARPYRCAVDNCNSAFKDKCDLKKHSFIHDMSKHVICDLCGKTFSRKHRLEAHLRTHAPRIKQVECHVCHDKFYTERYLTKHMKQKHAKKRQQFICDMCDFSTHNKPSIVMHIKYGHNTNKGKCKICGKAYKRNVHLRLHYKNTHGVLFKTHARMNIPKMEVQVKQEPMDLVPDLEFDLLDIDKEEPFAGFEPTESDLKGVKEQEQTLQQFLMQVMNATKTDESLSLNDPSHKSEIDKPEKKRSRRNNTKVDQKMSSKINDKEDQTPSLRMKVAKDKTTLVGLPPKRSQKSSKEVIQDITCNNDNNLHNNEALDDMVYPSTSKGIRMAKNLFITKVNEHMVREDDEELSDYEEVMQQIARDSKDYENQHNSVEPGQQIEGIANIEQELSEDNTVEVNDEEWMNQQVIGEHENKEKTVETQQNLIENDNQFSENVQPELDNAEYIHTQNIENLSIGQENTEVITLEFENNADFIHKRKDDQSATRKATKDIEMNAEIILPQHNIEDDQYIPTEIVQSNMVDTDEQETSGLIQEVQVENNSQVKILQHNKEDGQCKTIEDTQGNVVEDDIEEQSEVSQEVENNKEVKIIHHNKDEHCLTTEVIQGNVVEDDIEEQSEVSQEIQVETNAEITELDGNEVDNSEKQSTSEVVQEVQIENGEERSYMPVEEFIQRVMGDVDDQPRENELMVVDEEQKEDVERRLRNILVKMKRSTAGEAGKCRGQRKLRMPTAEEIENANKKKDHKGQQPKQIEKKVEVVDQKEKKKEMPSSLKKLWNMHQCYVCFELFPTKPLLVSHCATHFSVSTTDTLKRCPLCEYSTRGSDIRRHLKRKHGEDVCISFMQIQDRKDNAAGSRYYYETKNEKIKELEIIPSVRILNKKASMEIDRKNRELNDKLVGKRKLVRKGDEWIVEKEKLDLKDHVIPDSKDLDKNSENYLEVIKKLGKEAKKKGVKMLYPCNKCEKICQNLSALTLHGRRHDPNPKPFRPRGFKDENKKVIKDNVENRTATPKPIVNNHKCDPKLMDFYEKNIKGADIEFWQFLKIYNKMNKEKVNSFKDLESTTEFGVHFDFKNPAINLDDIPELELNAKSKSAGSKKALPKGINKKFIRTIRLTKVEYNKRMEIKNKMREKLRANDGSN